MTTVRAAITQTTWTGDKASMLDRHEQFARDAAADGAQVVCFQELFYGPYFGITQDKKYYRYAEPVDGPIVERFAAVAKELGTVMVLPIYEGTSQIQRLIIARDIFARGSPTPLAP